jgi:hypothetical protein
MHNFSINRSNIYLLDSGDYISSEYFFKANSVLNITFENHNNEELLFSIIEPDKFYLWNPFYPQTAISSSLYYVFTRFLTNESFIIPTSNKYVLLLANININSQNVILNNKTKITFEIHSITVSKAEHLFLERSISLNTKDLTNELLLLQF